MSEEQNKLEKQVDPNSEGYTLVKYSEFTVLMGLVIGAILFFLLFVYLSIKSQMMRFLIILELSLKRWELNMG